MNYFLKATGKVADHKTQLPPIAYPSRRADASYEVLIRAACREGARVLLRLRRRWCSSGGLHQAVRDGNVGEGDGCWPGCLDVC